MNSKQTLTNMKSEVKSHKAQMEINQANIEMAIDRIKEMVSRRGLVLTEEPILAIPRFESKTQEKKFKRRMTRVCKCPTMRTSNSFLSHLGNKSRVDYSKREKSIIESRMKYRDSLKATIELRNAYLEEKGDYYKSISKKS